MKALIARIVVLFSVVLMTACSYAKANMQTLVTNDCGKSWTLIGTGEHVPSTMGPCSYKVTIPDYPMQGETKFKTSFKNKVLADVEISYDYSIVDGKKFIGEAKFLGRANSDPDGGENSNALYEVAENSVIDKRIREVTSASLVNEDIVDFSQAEFEDKLLAAVNKELDSRGVRLNSLTFVPIPQEQTMLAIDMATAMKVYESKGLTELGQRVTVARAGAAKIQVSTPASPVQAEK